MTMISRVCAESSGEANMAKPGELSGIGFHTALRLSDADVIAAISLGGFLQARPEQLEPADHFPAR